MMQNYPVCHGHELNDQLPHRGTRSRSPCPTPCPKSTGCPHLVQTVPALVQVRLQAREVVREDGAGHGGGGVVQADDVVEPAVGDEDGLPRLDDLRDDGSLRLRPAQRSAA